MITQTVQSTGYPLNQEDFLKLLECTNACLQLDMMKYRYASLTTFKRRQMFAIQAIGDKITLLATKFVGMRITCIEIRSAVVPTDQEDRLHWVRVFELLMKLKVKSNDHTILVLVQHRYNCLTNIIVFQKMCLEQKKVTKALQKEQAGLITVNKSDQVKELCPPSLTSL